MAISFQQTDSGSVCGAATYCSANGLNGVTSLRQATIGGTPGTAQVGVSLSGTNVIAIFFECIVGGGVSWDAGTWTINLDITASATGGSPGWTGLDICRLSSGCINQASIASSTFSAIGVGSTGVKTVTVAGSAQTPSTGDKVMVMLSFSLAGPAQSIFYTPNVTIDSPFNLTLSPNSLMLVGVGT